MISLRQIRNWSDLRLPFINKKPVQLANCDFHYLAYATDKDIVVKYSGHIVQMHHDYSISLSVIQKRVEDLLGETFNHVMLNRYKNGKEYIGKHRDTKENKVS